MFAQAKESGHECLIKSLHGQSSGTDNKSVFSRKKSQVNLSKYIRRMAQQSNLPGLCLLMLRVQWCFLQVVYLHCLF